MSELIPNRFNSDQVFYDWSQIPPNLMLVIIKNKISNTLRLFASDLGTSALSFLALVPRFKYVVYNKISLDEARIARQQFLFPLGILAVGVITGSGIPYLVSIITNK